MPSFWNASSVPTAAGWPVQDINAYNRAPVMIAQQQSKQIPEWNRMTNLFGTIKWQNNMGDVMQGIIQEHSPIIGTQFVPANVTEQPRTNLFETRERSNFARIKRHWFQSPQISFLSSFRDFYDRRLPWASKDLSRQIGLGNEFFIRTQMLAQSPYMYFMGLSLGAGVTDPLQRVPYGEVSVNPITGAYTDPKDLNNNIGKFVTGVGTNGATGLPTFREICALRDTMQNELRIPPWEGSKAMPGGANEVLKGTYVIMGHAEIYQNLTYDTAVLNTKNYDRDLLNKPFMGVIGGNVNFLEERYPLRIAIDSDGTQTGTAGALYYPQAEVEMAVNPEYGCGNVLEPGSALQANPAAVTSKEVVPNPYYINADWGVGWFFGHLPYETIQVGPPPTEFAKQSIASSKFVKMQWNGVVRLTDNILRNYGNGIYDTNKFGDVVQLIADVTMGIIPNTPRYCVPFVYRRAPRTALLAPASLIG